MVKGISKLVMDLTVRLTCVKGKVKSDSRFDLSFAKDQMCSKSNFSSREIACAYCSWSSIGETGRSFSKRKKEHIQNIKSCKTGCNIAPHAWRESIESPHAWSIDFNVTMLE